MSIRPSTRTRPRTRCALGLAVIFAVAVGLVGCTGGDDLADESTTSEPTGTDSATNPDLDPDSDISTDSAGSGRDGSGVDDVGEPDLMVMIDQETGEDPAQPPDFDDDDRHLEPGDTDHVDDPKDPDDLAPLDQGSALLCAVIEIGRNAVADGDTSRVASLSQTLTDKLPPIGDDRLRTIADGLATGAGLDPAGLDEGLVRCETLGYESSI